MPNFVLIDNKISKIKPKPQLKRDYKYFDEKSVYLILCQKISYQETTKTEALMNVLSISKIIYYRLTINQHAPFKRVSKRQAKLKRKPWITTGILKSISVKNKLYKRFLKSKDKFWYQRYKYYRETLNHLIRKSKRMFYKDYFDDCKNDIKNVWKGINDLIG